MQRFGLALTSAFLVACATAALLPNPAMAFETESGAVTVPGASTQFQDPDEKPLPAPLSSPRPGEDGASLQMGPSGLQMAPTTDGGNPADNRALIPSP
jgi:hypothetical protein